MGLCRSICLTVSLAVSLSLTATLAVGAQTKKKPPVKPHNTTRGTDQVKGGDGIFGETYSLKSGFNFRITSAEFTVERFVAYETQYAAPDQKMLLMHVSLKNANKTDNFFDPSGHEFTVVDTNDEDHKGHNWRRDSLREKEAGITLKPGQGVEDMTVCVAVPAHTSLKKIILEQGRFGTNEDVIRFPLDNPKNKIAPLPEYARDPSDKTGSFTLPELPAKIGMTYPLNRFDMKVNSIAYSDDTYSGNKAEDDKRYLVANVTVKARVPGDSTLFEFKEGTATVKDSEGDKIDALKDNGYLKAKSDETADPKMKENDEYTCRIFFAVPKKATLKTLTLSESGSRSYVFDLSGVK